LFLLPAHVFWLEFRTRVLSRYDGTPNRRKAATEEKPEHVRAGNREAIRNPKNPKQDPKEPMKERHHGPASPCSAAAQAKGKTKRRPHTGKK